MTQDNLFTTRQKCDPEKLSWDERIWGAVALLGFEDILLMTCVDGEVTGIDIESRGGGAKPLPDITLKDVETLKGRCGRSEGETPAEKAESPKRREYGRGNGNEGRTRATARLFLFLHHGEQMDWGRKSEVTREEVEDFIREEGELLMTAVHYSASKTTKVRVLLPASWIGGYYLMFRECLGKAHRLIRLFFDGLLDEGNTDGVLTATRERIRAVGKLARWATPPDEVHEALVEGFREFSE